MRLTKVNPKVTKIIEDQQINHNDYRLALYFESKEDKNIIVPIAWQTVKRLAYTDDVINVGLIGEIVIDNISGIFDNLLNNTDNFYIGYYNYSTLSKYEENVYFSIISSEAIASTRTSTSCHYRLMIQESFLVEGANKNVNSMGLAIQCQTSSKADKIEKSTLELIGLSKPVPSDNTSLVSKNIHDILDYDIALITSDLKINASPSIDGTNNVDFKQGDLSIEKSDKISRIVELDKSSVEYFKNNYPTDLVGEAIFKSIDDKESALMLLKKVNNNLFFPKVTGKNSSGKADKVTFTVGDIGTARSENLSFIQTNTTVYKDGINNFGERKLTIRNIKDTFTRAFQDNMVYETFVNTDSNSSNIKLYSVFVTKSFFYNINLLPVNTVQVNNEWCDYIVSPLNQPDVMSGLLFRFNDIVSTFNKDYLHNKALSNIDVSSYSSRGIARKTPPFNDNTLNFAVSSKAIKTLFTLNNMAEITLPGNIFRKANEIVYIDDNITPVETRDDTNTQSTFNNSLIDKYYFVTRVNHIFTGSKYVNILYLCAFCKPIKK